MPEAKSNKENKTKPTKLECKAFYEDCKRTLNNTWQSTSDESSDADEVDVPSNFKSYTIQDRKIMLQQPKRVKPEQLGESYDGPEDAKKVDLANPGEESRPVYIATDLTLEDETLLIATLKEYKDVFAWSYKDLKGVDLTICQHTIPMKDDAKPRKQRPYTYNDNFGRKIKEETYRMGLTYCHCPKKE